MLLHCIAEIDNEKSKIKKRNEKKAKKLMLKNSKITHELCNTEKKIKTLIFSIEKIKANYEKYLRKCHGLDSDLKREKSNKLKEHVDFSQIEKHEQKKLLVDKIAELNDKTLSFKERDKWKQKHNVRPDKMQYKSKKKHNRTLQFEERIKEKRSEIGEVMCQTCIGSMKRN